MPTLKEPEYCALARCKVEVKKHGDFCCEEHRGEYWGDAKTSRLTIPEMQKRVLSWHGKRDRKDLIAERNELRRMYRDLKSELDRIEERGKRLSKEIGTVSLEEQVGDLEW